MWNGGFMFFLNTKQMVTQEVTETIIKGATAPSLIAALHIVNLIYVFPEMKQRGLVPNSYSHVSVND